MEASQNNGKPKPQKVRKFVRRLTVAMIAVSIITAVAIYATEVIHVI